MWFVMRIKLTLYIFRGCAEGALSMLGKVQLELQKLVDTYVSIFQPANIQYFDIYYKLYHDFSSSFQRSHIIMTITNPSECLLSELRKVEVWILINCLLFILNFIFIWTSNCLVLVDCLDASAIVDGLFLVLHYGWLIYLYTSESKIYKFDSEVRCVEYI